MELFFLFLKHGDCVLAVIYRICYRSLIEKESAILSNRANYISCWDFFLDLLVVIYVWNWDMEVFVEQRDFVLENDHDDSKEDSFDHIA